jgi:hypothetical protein
MVKFLETSFTNKETKMKKIAMLVLTVTALVPMYLSNALAERRESTELNWTAQSFTTTAVINVSGYDRFSVQAVYGSGTQSTHTITSGARAQATITVANTSSALIISTQASTTVNVASTTGVSGDAVTINGIVFREGVHWNVAASTPLTAANLRAVIDAHPDFQADVLGATVTVRYVTVGTSGNGLPVLTTDSTWLRIPGATMTGGIARHTVNINGVTLTEGSSFVVATTSLTTASNLMTAINADSTLSTQLVASTTTTSSTTTAIVTLKALNTGTSAFNIYTSTPAFFGISSGFPGGATSDVNIVTDIITKTGHGLTTALPVLVATSGTNVAPTGLFGGTTYYAIKINDNSYALATSQANAIAGTKIDITGITNEAVASLYPVPLSLAAGNGFYWQASNDGTNFSTLSISSVTYSAAGTTVWDFGVFNYKYIIVNFLKPTNGAIALAIKLFGTRE